MTTPSRLDSARRFAKAHGFDLDAPLRVGGNYQPLTEHAGIAHLSGQVPRIGDTVVATGCVGESVSLAQARQAAEVSTLRLLAILHQSGGLDRVVQVLKLGVFVQSAAGFTQQSEVADAASDLLVAVFGAAGTHARTSVGVFQLPKDAAVELDLAVSVTPSA